MQHPQQPGISLQTPPGTTAMAFTASVDASWLTLNPTSGTTPSTIQVTPSISGLSAGTLTGHITLSIPSAANPSITVTVTLNLASAPTASVAPSAITLQGTAGSPPTYAPTNLYISTASSQSVTYSVSSSAGWLVLGGATSGSVTSGSPAVILVSGDPTQGSLTQGTYSGTITLTQGSITSTVPVTFTVAAQPTAVSLDKQQLNVTANAGGTSTSAGSAYLTTTPGTLAFTAVSSVPWLTVSPSSGTGSQTLSFTANPSSLRDWRVPGDRHGHGRQCQCLVDRESDNGCAERSHIYTDSRERFLHADCQPYSSACCHCRGRRRGAHSFQRVELLAIAVDRGCRAPRTVEPGCRPPRFVPVNCRSLSRFRPTGIL